MVMLWWTPLRRWWQTTFEAPGVTAEAPALLLRRPATARVRATVVAGPRSSRPVTPFRAQPASSVDGARRAARRFWMTLDPQDRRRAAIGGSFAEVCAALEKLAAVEEGRVG